MWRSLVTTIQIPFKYHYRPAPVKRIQLQSSWSRFCLWLFCLMTHRTRPMQKMIYCKTHLLYKGKAKHRVTVFLCVHTSKHSEPRNQFQLSVSAGLTSVWMTNESPALFNASFGHKRKQLLRLHYGDIVTCVQCCPLVLYLFIYLFLSLGIYSGLFI